MNGTMRTFGRRKLMMLGAFGATGLACTRTPPSTNQSEMTMTPTIRPDSGRMPVLFVGHGSPMNAITDTPYGALGTTSARRSRRRARSSASPRTGMWTAPSSPETRHRGRSTTSAGSRGLSSRCSIRPGAMRRSPTGSRRCSRPTMRPLTARGARPRDMVRARAPATRCRPARDPAQHRSPRPRGDASRDRSRARAPARSGDPDPRERKRHAQPRFRHAGARRRDATVGISRRRHGDARDDGARCRRARASARHRGRPHVASLTRSLLPLLYAAGAANGDDAVSFPVTGFDLGSLSMRSIRFG